MKNARNANPQPPLAPDATLPHYAATFRAGGRSYSFEVSEDGSGQRCLTIAETAEIDSQQQRDQQLVVIQQDMRGFLKGLSRAAIVCDPDMKPFNVEAIRERFPRAYEPWSSEEEKILMELFSDGFEPDEIARMLYRRLSEIFSRLRQIRYRELLTVEPGSAED